MSETATVYGLSSSRDGALRYIGQTHCTIWMRLAAHQSNAKNLSDKPLYAWMRAEEAAGHKIKISVLKADAVWNDDEDAEIEKARAAGADLINRRGGGGSPVGESLVSKRDKNAKTKAERARQEFYNRYYCGGVNRRGNRSAARLLLKYAMGEYRP